MLQDEVDQSVNRLVPPGELSLTFDCDDHLGETIISILGAPDLLEQCKLGCAWAIGPRQLDYVACQGLGSQSVDAVAKRDDRVSPHEDVVDARESMPCSSACPFVGAAVPLGCYLDRCC